MRIKSSFHLRLLLGIRAAHGIDIMCLAALAWNHIRLSSACCSLFTAGSVCGRGAKRVDHERIASYLSFCRHYGGAEPFSHRVRTASVSCTIYMICYCGTWELFGSSVDESIRAKTLVCHSPCRIYDSLCLDHDDGVSEIAFAVYATLRCPSFKCNSSPGVLQCCHWNA